MMNVIPWPSCRWVVVQQGFISQSGGCWNKQNSIESHYNDIKSHINFAKEIIVVNIRGCNQTCSLLEKGDH